MIESRKPFDIMLWKKGWPVETRGSRTVEITNIWGWAAGRVSMRADIDGEKKDFLEWNIDGRSLRDAHDPEASEPSSADLFMRPIFYCKERAVYPGDTLFNLKVMNLPQPFTVDDYKMASQFNPDGFSWEKPEEKPHNVWEDAVFAPFGEVGAALLADDDIIDAYRVIQELRQCEGAMRVNEDDRGFIARLDREEDCIDFCNLGSSSFLYGHLAPFFPTRELYEAALDKVGRARVIAAIKTLEGVKG